jgi:Chlamydia polymorphic membrane protein (Chlamydia_PMP) repeat
MRRIRNTAILLVVLAAATAVTACGTTASPVTASLAAASATVRPALAGPPPGLRRNAAEPATVIGDGTAASCTSQAVVAAVAAGGMITFSCGPSPVTITMTATAKVRNTSARVVIDGGGLVTLSGGGRRRILYMDTCDRKQVWTTPHCQDQSRPRLTVRNLTFADGNSTGRHFDGGGGGAIFALGGRLRVVNSHFTDNRCDATGPDLGGAAIRALSQYHGLPVYVINSTFRGGTCSNGGALSSIGVSWVIRDSLMASNRALGWGANPAPAGTPGGGSGGAIYADGNNYTVKIYNSIIRHNHATEGGGAIFFVSDNLTGILRINRSTLHDNPSAGFHTAGYPGIYFLGAGHPIIIDSVLS